VTTRSTADASVTAVFSLVPDEADAISDAALAAYVATLQVLPSELGGPDWLSPAFSAGSNLFERDTTPVGLVAMWRDRSERELVERIERFSVAGPHLAELRHHVAHNVRATLLERVRTAPHRVALPTSRGIVRPMLSTGDLHAGLGSVAMAEALAQPDSDLVPAVARLHESVCGPTASVLVASDQADRLPWTCSRVGTARPHARNGRFVERHPRAVVCGGGDLGVRSLLADGAVTDTVTTFAVRPCSPVEFGRRSAGLRALQTAFRRHLYERGGVYGVGIDVAISASTISFWTTIDEQPEHTCEVVRRLVDGDVAVSETGRDSAGAALRHLPRQLPPWESDVDTAICALLGLGPTDRHDVLEGSREGHGVAAVRSWLRDAAAASVIVRGERARRESFEGSRG